MTARELFDAARALIGKRAVIYTTSDDVGFGERQDDGRMRYTGVVLDVAGHAPDGQIDVTLDPREGVTWNRTVRDIASIEAEEPPTVFRQPPPATVNMTLDDINRLVDNLLAAGWVPGQENSVVVAGWVPGQENSVVVAVQSWRAVEALLDAGWGPTTDD